jgi:hypothetical protein
MNAIHQVYKQWPLLQPCLVAKTPQRRGYPRSIEPGTQIVAKYEKIRGRNVRFESGGGGAQGEHHAIIQ